MNEPIADRVLIARSLQGDHTAYAELVRRYQQSVFAVCYRLTGERRDAEDMTQDTFIRAHHKLKLYDMERPFGPWVRRVASNLTLNYLQKRRANQVELDEEFDQPSADAGENPEMARVSAETAHSVREAILALPPHFRAVIEMRHFQSLSYDEMAEALQLPVNTVRSHLFRARKKLARQLHALA